MLTGKNVVLGITGSIAAYKIATLASSLKKLHCNVDVIMTENATNFIHPITFETLTGNRCMVDTFDRNFQYNVEHVALAKKADLMLIAPASADFIGKAANGIADDMLSTQFMACMGNAFLEEDEARTCAMLIAPAMNTRMFASPIVQENLTKLEQHGVKIIQPNNGYLACGDVGAGKMEEPEMLLEYILAELACKKDMTGMKVCVTAGPTREAIDPVRYISNNSTGKMGYAIAKNAMLRGAEVTLIAGPTSLKDVPFVKMVHIQSAKQMYDAVIEAAKTADIVVKAAAVADYRPSNVADEKIKKSDGDMAIALERTQDIIGTLGQNKREGQFLCGFSMETEHMLENSKAKLAKKNLDMIVANNVKVEGAGFGTDTNVVTLITKDSMEELDIMSKDEVASTIFDQILAMKSE